MTPYRTAVVTGASGGIGRAIVTELVRLGLQVHALGLPDDTLEAMRCLDDVTVHPVDVRLADELAATLDGIVDGGGVDVLVNNAGIIGDLRPAHESTIATADALIDINLRAAVHSTMAVLPGMVRRNLGHIVFTGSIAGYRPTANGAVYSATKAALVGMALMMPAHVDVTRVEVVPTMQVFGGSAVAAQDSSRFS